MDVMDVLPLKEMHISFHEIQNVLQCLFHTIFLYHTVTMSSKLEEVSTGNLIYSRQQDKQTNLRIASLISKIVTEIQFANKRNVTIFLYFSYKPYWCWQRATRFVYFKIPFVLSYFHEDSFHTVRQNLFKISVFQIFPKLPLKKLKITYSLDCQNFGV